MNYCNANNYIKRNGCQPLTDCCSYNTVQEPAGRNRPQGVPGNTGCPGPQGEQGIPGPLGEKGDQGEQGERGEQGIAGETPEITVEEKYAPDL